MNKMYVIIKEEFKDGKHIPKDDEIIGECYTSLDAASALARFYASKKRSSLDKLNVKSRCEGLYAKDKYQKGGMRVYYKVSAKKENITQFRIHEFDVLNLDEVREFIKGENENIFN